MPRIKVKSSLTLSETFEAFLMSKKSEGLSNKTLTTYEGHLKCISHHLNIFLPLSDYVKADFDQMIESMRESNLSSSSIASYVRTLRSFLSWARNEHLTTLNISKFKSGDTIKDTYSDEELAILLQKPNLNQCSFSE